MAAHRLKVHPKRRYKLPAESATRRCNAPESACRIGARVGIAEHRMVHSINRIHQLLEFLGFTDPEAAKKKLGTVKNPIRKAYI
jgi:hypothetical protein